jgi:tubulin-specific chaperone E
LLEALAKKYASGDQPGSSSNSEIHISGKVVEEVGFEDIRQRLAKIHELRIVLLDALCVVGVRALPWVSSSELHLQEQKRIADQNLKIVELDLSRNLLEKWVDVANICSTLKSLKSLKVK